MLQSPLPLPVLPTKGRRFHVMAKPVGAACNLDCTYCYYLSKGQLEDIGTGRMNDQVLERYICDYIRSNDSPEIEFTWQGGEPTLLGLDFFRKVVALQKKHRPNGKRILNDLQTNGTLIDEEWVTFFKEEQFWIGLSIDGPRDIHDAYRVTKKHAPTFDDVVRTFRLLKKARVPVNTLTVVSSINVKRPLDVYRFLVRELNSDRIQFLPCVEPKSFAGTAPQFWPPEQQPIVGTDAAKPNTPDSVVTDWSVDATQYGDFLCRVFDDWHRRDLGKVFVNLFETMVSQHMGLGAQLCVFNEFCGKALVVEHDGSLYSCDHYAFPEYRLGNISQQEMEHMVFSERQVSFGMAKGTTLPTYCLQCAYLKDCWGECPRNRFLRTPDGSPGLNYLCPGLKMFFHHVTPRVAKLAASNT
jgi:uncharacterized protein